MHTFKTQRFKYNLTNRIRIPQSFQEFHFWKSSSRQQKKQEEE